MNIGVNPAKVMDEEKIYVFHRYKMWIDDQLQHRFVYPVGAYIKCEDNWYIKDRIQLLIKAKSEIPDWVKTICLVNGVQV